MTGRAIHLVHADGKLPNLALMRLATYFRARGDRVRLLRGFVARTLFDVLDEPSAIGAAVGAQPGAGAGAGKERGSR